MRYFIGVLFLLVPFHVSAATIPEVSFVVQSDNTWKSSTVEESVWYRDDFNDEDWSYAVSSPVSTCLKRHFLPGVSAMWHPDRLPYQKAYFRKAFHVGGDIESAVLQAHFAGVGEIYINGERVKSFIDTAEVSSYLQFGTNTIAISVEDTFDVCQWVQVDFELTVSFGQILDAPLFIQYDEEWADSEYAAGKSQHLWCGNTMEDCGCAVTSMAMVLRYHGVHTSPSGDVTTPKSLHDYFMKGNTCTDAGCSSLGFVYGNVRWNALNSYSKEAYDIYGTPKIQFTSIAQFNKDSYDLSTEVGDPVILKTGDRSHWVVGHGYMSDGIWIRDPHFFRKRLTENDPAYPVKAVNYTKVNSNFSLIEVFSRSRDVFITDETGKRSGISAQGDILEEIPGSFVEIMYDIDSPSSERGGGEVVWVSVLAPLDGQYRVSKPLWSEAAIYLSDKASKTQKKTVAKGRSGVVVGYVQADISRNILRELVEQNYCKISSEYAG